MAGNLPGSTEGRKIVSSLDLLHLAKTAAERGRRATCAASSGRRTRARWTAKGSRDFVTEVDRTAERIIAEVLLAAEPGQPDRRRGAEPRPGHRRTGLDRGPARRDHQLSARFSELCGIDRRGGGRRARGRGGGARAAPGVYTARPGRRRLAGRPTAGGLPDRRPGLRAHRHRLPLQGYSPLGDTWRQFAPGGGPDQRHPPARLRGARPRRRRRRPVRGLLGAAALGVGHRGGHPAGSGGGRRGHRFRRPGRRGGAYRRRRRKPRDSRWLLGCGLPRQGPRR